MKPETIIWKTTVTATILLACGAHAAPSADEVKQLGTTLTAWGAEVAGNKDGTIPAYDGGVKNPPKVDYRTGVLPDPYADDKVLFWIDAKNMDKYADKLSRGTQEMLKKYPTFRIAVYPTRRSASYPQGVSNETIKNATRCSLKDEGETLDVSKGCRGGFPFPIPQSGHEVMWNHAASYMGAGRIHITESNVVKPSGEVVNANKMYAYEDNQLYDPDTKTPTRHWGIRTEYSGPTRLAGQSTLIFDMLEKNARKSWSYQPSTRRVRLAPDLAGDTPIASQGGAQVYDEINMFSGATDRWDLKLVGKKEMYIPYNIYQISQSKECSAAGGLYKPFHANPDCIRWELHRVWHVEATLKQGKRHVYGKRDFFFDEDTWFGGLQDTYDLNGKPYHVVWAPLRPDYVKHAPNVGTAIPSFDLSSGTYVFPVIPKAWSLSKPLPAASLTPDSLPNFVLKDPETD
jgi:hypothetical protein